MPSSSSPKTVEDRHIANINRLKSEMGDLTKGKVKAAIEEFDKINDDWNLFIDNCITDFGGTPTTFKTEEEKIAFLAERSFYKEKDDFKSKLQSQVNKRDAQKRALKSKAEEILKKQQELIEKNNEIIKKLNEKIQEDISKRDELDREIKDQQSELFYIENNKGTGKVNVLLTKISALESEISNLDPTTAADEMNSKKELIKQYQNEIKELRFKAKDLSASINSKKSQKSKLKINDRLDRIDKLSRKNDSLKEHLEQNYNELTAAFSKDKDMTLSRPDTSIENTTPDTPSASGDGTPQTGEGGNNRGGNVAGTPNLGQTQPQQPQTALVKLTDKQIAMNMSREFRQAKTTEERRRMIDGYGYTDLVAMLDRVGPFERKRISNALIEARDYMPVPKAAELIANIKEITGDTDLANSAFKLLFAGENARYFKDLSVDELRNIQRVMDLANERREEIGKANPEALKYFDKNFASFVKTGSLVERARTGWFKNFWADMVNGKQKAARDNLSGSMRDYTIKVQDEKTQKAEYENNIRSMLGQEVKPVSDPMYTDRGYSRHDSLQQDVDRRSVNSEQPQQR